MIKNKQYIVIKVTSMNQISDAPLVHGYLITTYFLDTFKFSVKVGRKPE